MADLMTDEELTRTLNVLGKPTAFSLIGPPGSTDPLAGGIPAPPEIAMAPPGGGGTGGTGEPGMAPPAGISPERSNLPALAEDTGLGLSAMGKIASDVLKFGKKVGETTTGGGPTGSFEMSPETKAAYEAQRAGERDLSLDVGSLTPSPSTAFGAGLARLGPALNEVSGAELALEGLGEGAGAVGEGAAAGLPSFEQLTQGLGPALQAGGSVLGTALSAYKAALADNDFDKARGALHAALYAASLAFPPLAIAPAAADLVDTLVQAFGGPTLAQLLGFAPSDEWMAFAPTLSENLGTTGQALEQLGMDVVNAGDEQAIQDAIGKYTTTIGGFAGDFGVGEKYGGTGSGIAVPPGATGTEHEGGQTANWEEAVNMLEGLLETKRASFGGGGRGPEETPTPSPGVVEGPGPPRAAPDEGPMAPKLGVVDDVGQMAPNLGVVDDVGLPGPTGPPATRRGDVGPRGAARPINPTVPVDLNPPERVRRPYQPVERATGGPSQDVLGAGRRRLRLDDDEDED